MERIRNKERIVPGLTVAAAAVTLVALAAVAIGGYLWTPAAAYEQYSTNQADNCAACHGDFRAGDYVSNSDGVAWAGGTSLHNGHRTDMLSGDCNVCHGAQRFPVLLASSDGGTGFAAISCNGCHGRAEPAAGGAVKAVGLRQHHYRAGVTQCVSCHTDSNPANFTTAPETVKPLYYFTPDAAHPNKPTDPCNGNGSESLVAPTRGLDNDGDLVYDATDTDCQVGVEDGPAAKLGLTLEGVQPNPSRGAVRVAFTLPSARPATLDLMDVTGRRVARQDVGALGAGRHSVEFAPGRALRAGVYLVRLIQGGAVVTAKAVVTE
jgi:hypothetical protein